MYQDKSAQRNNVLSKAEIDNALKECVYIPPPNKSKHGQGISKCGAQWRDINHQIVREKFETAEAGILYRYDQLHQIELQRQNLVLTSPIERDADGVPVILTNQKRGGVAHRIKVNEEIYYALKQHNWTFSRENPWTTIDKKDVSMPAFVLSYYKHEKKDGQTIDHCQQDHDDCRIENLRYADKMIQAQNRKKATRSNASSKLIGVSKTNNGRWRGSINCNGVQYYQDFDTELEAGLHYNKLANELQTASCQNEIPQNIVTSSSVQTSKILGKPLPQSSQYRGVCKRNNKWEGKCKVNGKTEVKMFDHELDAANYYNEQCMKYRKRPILNVICNQAEQKPSMRRFVRISNENDEAIEKTATRIAEAQKTDKVNIDTLLRNVTKASQNTKIRDDEVIFPAAESRDGKPASAGNTDNNTTIEGHQVSVNLEHNCQNVKSTGNLKVCNAKEELKRKLITDFFAPSLKHINESPTRGVEFSFK